MNANDYMNWPFCHDLMALVISDLHPGLVQGRDFHCAHPVDSLSGGPKGDPFIAVWKAQGIEQPKDEDIKARFVANEARYRALFVRTFRDECLAWCDAKVVVPPDAPATFKAASNAWAAYRQALRDVPQQPGFPRHIEWPDLPT
jgi:hypothetical protein